MTALELIEKSAPKAIRKAAEEQRERERAAPGSSSGRPGTSDGYFPQPKEAETTETRVRTYRLIVYRD